MFQGNDHLRTFLPWGVVICASLLGALWDLRQGRIPNALTVPVWAGGMLWAFIEHGWIGPGMSLCSSGLLALPFVILFVCAGGGAGDAKLMAAVGAWLGLSDGSNVLLGVVVAGAMGGIGLALVKRQFKAVLQRLVRMTAGAALLAVPGSRLQGARTALQKSSEMLAMPYGVAIFLGVCYGAARMFL